MAHQHIKRTTHTSSGHEIASTLADVPEEVTAPLPTSTGAQGFPPASCPPGPKPTPCELQQAHTSLPHSPFHLGLHNHLNIAWVSRLLNGINTSAHTGWIRYTTHNNNTVKHPHITDCEPEKETAAGHTLSPFTHSMRMCAAAIHYKHLGWELCQNRMESGESRHHIEKTSLLLKSGWWGCPDHKGDDQDRPQGWYCVDTCLPFGLCSAPSIFNQLASAHHWVMANNYEDDLLHYLDDYLLTGPRRSTQTMLDVCERLGVPVATKAQQQTFHSRASPLAITQIWLVEFNAINMTDLLSAQKS